MKIVEAECQAMAEKEAAKPQQAPQTRLKALDSARARKLSFRVGN